MPERWQMTHELVDATLTDYSVAPEDETAWGSPSPTYLYTTVQLPCVYTYSNGFIKQTMNTIYYTLYIAACMYTKMDYVVVMLSCTDHLNHYVLDTMHTMQKSNAKRCLSDAPTLQCNAK